MTISFVEVQSTPQYPVCPPAPPLVPHRHPRPAPLPSRLALVSAAPPRVGRRASPSPSTCAPCKFTLAPCASLDSPSHWPFVLAVARPALALAPRFGCRALPWPLHLALAVVPCLGRLRLAFAVAPCLRHHASRSPLPRAPPLDSPSCWHLVLAVARLTLTLTHASLMHGSTKGHGSWDGDPYPYPSLPVTLTPTGY
jgi:hypothetical protein